MTTSGSRSRGGGGRIGDRVPDRPAAGRGVERARERRPRGRVRQLRTRDRARAVELEEHGPAGRTPQETSPTPAIPAPASTAGASPATSTRRRVQPRRGWTGPARAWCPVRSVTSGRYPRPSRGRRPHDARGPWSSRGHLGRRRPAGLARGLPRDRERRGHDHRPGDVDRAGVEQLPGPGARPVIHAQHPPRKTVIVMQAA